MKVRWLLTGIALVSTAEKALATITHGKDSIATCDLTSVTHTSSLSVSVAAEAVKSVNLFLCDEKEGVPEKASAHALALADSFVNAVVETTASCYAEGYASFKINGASLAYAQATAIAEAYAEAAAVAETCYKCHAATSLVAHSYEEIFLEATSKIDTTLHGIATGGNVSDSVSASAKSFIEITVVALAEVLVKAHAEVDKCASALQAIIKTGDEADANSVVCELNSTAADDEVIRNAIVEVSTGVAAHVCGEGLATASFEIEAKAIGSAMAIAITQVTLDCQVDGLGTVCALGKADITKTAEAVAYAFAFGYVSATSSCNTVCHNDISALTEAIATVLATATSHSLKSQCTGPDSYFDIDYTQTQIVETSIESLVKIITAATATSDGDCVIDLDIEAAVAPGQEQLVSGPPLDHRQPVAKPRESEHDEEPEHSDNTDPSHEEPDHPHKPEDKHGHPDKPHVKPDHPDKPDDKSEHPEVVSKPHSKPDAHPNPPRPASKPHDKSGSPAKQPPTKDKDRPSPPARRPAPKRRTQTRPAKRTLPKKNPVKKVQGKTHPRHRRRSSRRAPRRSRGRRSTRRVRRRRSADRSRRPRSVRRSRGRRSGRKPANKAGGPTKKAPARRTPSASPSGSRRPNLVKRGNSSPQSGQRNKRNSPQNQRSRRVTMAVAAARARRERERRVREIRSRRAKRDARRGRDKRRSRKARNAL